MNWDVDTPPPEPRVDRCNICGLRDEHNWNQMVICCKPHGRVICEECYIEWLDEGEPTPFFDLCPVRWDRVDAPPAEECIAELKSWVAA